MNFDQQSSAQKQQFVQHQQNQGRLETQPFETPMRTMASATSKNNNPLHHSNSMPVSAKKLKILGTNNNDIRYANDTLDESANNSSAYMFNNPQLMQQDNNTNTNAYMNQKQANYNMNSVNNSYPTQGQSLQQIMDHQTAQTGGGQFQSNTQKGLTLQQKVFGKLLSETHNQYCFDCGWKDPDYVSLNHGIFLCFNCAINIHKVHYGVEQSYIKSIFRAEWTYTQLRAIIHSGNHLCKKFFDKYDLTQEPIQKRYNTVAADFYRQKLRRTVERSGAVLDQLNSNDQMPSYQEGRAHLENQSITPQPSTKVNLQYSDVLQTLLNNYVDREVEEDRAKEEEKLKNTNLHNLYQGFLFEYQTASQSNNNNQSQNFNSPDKGQNKIEEPFTDTKLINNDDYQFMIEKVSDFVESSFTFGESIIKKLTYELASQTSNRAQMEELKQQMHSTAVEQQQSKDQYISQSAKTVRNGQNLEYDNQVSTSQSYLQRLKRSSGVNNVSSLKNKATEKLSAAWGYFYTNKQEQQPEEVNQASQTKRISAPTINNRQNLA